MTKEWKTTAQVEEMLSTENTDVPEETEETAVETESEIGQDTLALLTQPLANRREEKHVQELVVAFRSLQKNLRLLSIEPSVDPVQLQVQIELLDDDRQRIEAALDEKRYTEAWGLLDAAWLRFAQIVPDDRFALLLQRRIHSKHTGTGTQTLVGHFDALRNEAIMLVHHPAIDASELRSYVLVLEENRSEIEKALAVGQFDHAWFLLRKLWELRLGILPAERLEAEHKGLELLVPSTGRGNRRKALDRALDEASELVDLAEAKDVSRLRSLLIWVKREINESAQARYWRFNIYERRIKVTATILVVLLLLLSLAAVILAGPEAGSVGYRFAIVLAVLLAGGIGGAVSGLRTSDEMSQQRLSSAYFKQQVTNFRMLVGAAAALVVYVLLASGLLAITFGSGNQDLVYVGLGFLSGFSERFFLQALDRVGVKSGVAEQEVAQKVAEGESTTAADVSPDHAGEEKHETSGATAESTAAEKKETS
jgi:hypothetical protein